MVAGACRLVVAVVLVAAAVEVVVALASLFAPAAETLGETWRWCCCGQLGQKKSSTRENRIIKQHALFPIFCILHWDHARIMGNKIARLSTAATTVRSRLVVLAPDSAREVQLFEGTCEPRAFSFTFPKPQGAQGTRLNRTLPPRAVFGRNLRSCAPRRARAARAPRRAISGVGAPAGGATQKTGPREPNCNP